LILRALRFRQFGTRLETGWLKPGSGRKTYRPS
jgi:hypothetical protein